MADKHAFLPPSDADNWLICAGKPALEEQEPESTSEAAAEGTRKHELAARVLFNPRLIKPDELEDEPEVLAYIGAVNERMQAYREAGVKHLHLAVEQKLDISGITGERGAQGTADCIIVAEFSDYVDMDVIDAKFGFVPVDPNTAQIKLYGLAAVLKYQLLHDFRRINLGIFQPKVSDTLSFIEVSSDELYVFGAKVTEAAALSLSLRGDVTALSHLVPGEKQCRFCKVKHRCPALAQSVAAEVLADFDAMDDPAALPVDPVATIGAPADLPERLARAMAKVGLIEDWCLAVRAKVEALLFENTEVPGFKLVMGRKGPRAWTDPEQAAGILALGGFKAELTHTKPALLSPTQIEKIAKDSAVWKELTTLTKQSDGKPSVAPAEDSRPPWSPVKESDFKNLEHEDLA